jgi:hypothetical protein
LMVRKRESTINNQPASIPDRTSEIARQYRDLIGTQDTLRYSS